jgi:hypothetical protein
MDERRDDTIIVLRMRRIEFDMVNPFLEQVRPYLRSVQRPACDPKNVLVSGNLSGCLQRFCFLTILKEAPLLEGQIRGPSAT